MTTVPPGAAPSAARRTALSVLGVPVVIDDDRLSWPDRIRALLDPFVVTGGPPAGAVVLAVEGADGRAVLRLDGVEVVRGDGWRIEARLLAELNARVIAGYAGFAVHAGVVARGDRVVCFPGRSGLGKSTMTAACLQAGFRYGSDEALCLDRPTGSVVPYPRPLALSRSSCALLGIDGSGGSPTADDEVREVHLTARELGAASLAVTDRPRLTDIVELQRGATEVHLEPLHRARAVPALLSMSFNHYKEPDSSIELVGRVAREVRVWRLHHDDPREAAAVLARELG